MEELMKKLLKPAAGNGVNSEEKQPKLR